jgi:Na+/proline symporter
MIIVIFIPGIMADTDSFSRLGELPAEMLNGTELGLGFLIGTMLFLPWSVLVRMDVWQRILAAKSEKIAKKVSFWSGMGMLPFYFIFPLVGMAMKIILDYDLDEKESADVAYLFINRHSGGFIMAFAVVGLLSALMSSGDSFLNIISISAVKDFVGWGKKKGEVSKEKAHQMIRISTIIFGVVALFIALVFPNIVDLMVVGISTITIFAPITILALVSKNAFAYRKAALSSILVAFVINLVLFSWGIIFPDQFQAKTSFVPSFILGTVVLLIGVKLTRVNPDAAKKEV